MGLISTESAVWFIYLNKEGNLKDWTKRMSRRFTTSMANPGNKYRQCKEYI